jgi:hypothetical protein
MTSENLSAVCTAGDDFPACDLYVMCRDPKCQHECHDGQVFCDEAGRRGWFPKDETRLPG